MDSSENLERRVTAVEAEVAVVRQEAAAARALAAGADRDVADYRAEMRSHTRVLAALRATQLAHYAEHKADFAELRTEVRTGLAEVKAEVRTGLVEVEAHVAEVKAGVGHIVRLLEAPDGGPGRTTP